VAVLADPDWPDVSVVVPVLNEADHLAAAVAAIVAQGYPGRLEVVLAVGPSRDGTEGVAAALAEADARVVVVPNPSGRTPAALNAAIAASTGAVVVRVDGHSELSPGYVQRAVETLATTGAANVGGIQRAVGDTGMQRAIAAAMTSPFGVGDAKFHYGGAPGPVDTVYLGVFRRDVLDRHGGYDESLVRNQDYELNWRIREGGGTVWFDPELEVTYRPRPTLRSLASQYFQYGQWKRVVLRRHPRSVRWRQLVAPAALLANLAGLLIGAAWRPALLVPVVYSVATVVSAVSVRGIAPSVRLRLPMVFATMHWSWGLGFLLGSAKTD
jgi:succinoglycan biosynthesis protein ExoA